MKTNFAQMMHISNLKCDNKYLSHQDAEVTCCIRKHTPYYFFDNGWTGARTDLENYTCLSRISCWTRMLQLLFSSERRWQNGLPNCMSMFTANGKNSSSMVIYRGKNLSEKFS